MLDIDELDAGYGDVAILHGITLTVGEAEIVALVGANGAGKTTLLRAVSGLLHLRAGRVRLRGRDITGWPAFDLVAAGLVHVPENRALFGPMTVLENLELGAYTRESRRRFHETLAEVLDLFPVLAERRRQLAATMSGGEQQMLAIARGLMARPSLLALDEPSLGLAPRMVTGIFEAILEIRRRGTTILLVEQDVKQALKISDRGYVIENGCIVHCETSAALLASDTVRRAYLGSLDPSENEAER